MNDLTSLYNKTKSSLEKLGFRIGAYKSINYGIQFSIAIDNVSGMIRIYSSRKGIKIDLSQVPHLKTRNIIARALGVAETAGGTDDDAEISLPMIGTDESGKGDYFGPLVVGAVYVDAATERVLRDAGVRDSKELSEEKIMELGDFIERKTVSVVHAIMPEQYNMEYRQYQNLNKLLAQAHADAVFALFKKVPCRTVLSDQFGDERHLRRLLEPAGISIHQRPRAEQFMAVAAGSILARRGFVEGIRKLSAASRITLPKGNSGHVISAAKAFVKMNGREALASVAKLHFKTTADII